MFLRSKNMGNNTSLILLKHFLRIVTILEMVVFWHSSTKFCKSMGDNFKEHHLNNLKP